MNADKCTECGLVPPRGVYRSPRPCAKCSEANKCPECGEQNGRGALGYPEIHISGGEEKLSASVEIKRCTACREYNRNEMILRLAREAENAQFLLSLPRLRAQAQPRTPRHSTKLDAYVKAQKKKSLRAIQAGLHRMTKAELQKAIGMKKVPVLSTLSEAKKRST
jgi:hypothetical protein